MAQSKAKLLVVGQSTNGNGIGPHISDPNDFPIPLEGIITVELTTGRVVEMVIGELEMLYELGEIPNELTRIAARELTVPTPTNDSEREKRFADRLKLVKWVVGRVLVSPKIDTARLYNDEVWQIYNMANSPALALDNFRRQQARHVGVVRPVQDVGTSAEPEGELSPTQE